MENPKELCLRDILLPGEERLTHDEELLWSKRSIVRVSVEGAYHYIDTSSLSDTSVGHSRFNGYGFWGRPGSSSTATEDFLRLYLEPENLLPVSRMDLVVGLGEDTDRYDWDDVPDYNGDEIFTIETLLGYKTYLGVSMLHNPPIKLKSTEFDKTEAGILVHNGSWDMEVPMSCGDFRLLEWGVFSGAFRMEIKAVLSD